MKSRTIRIVLIAAAASLGLGLACIYALLGSYVYLEPSLPTAASMRDIPVQGPLRIYSRGGELIEQIGDQRREPVAYEDIPPIVREAFVAAEDERFFEHHGFDYKGVIRAAFNDLVSGEYSQGASTITMQAARRIFLTLDKTIKRKLQEVFLTYRMEQEFSKEEILDTYLNVIFFGQRAYGVAAAAETYFGKPLSELSVSQAATLAGIPNAPSRYNPVISPRAAAGRRHYVLRRMTELHYIDAATAQRADAEPIDAREHAQLTDVEASYVAEMARADLVNRFGEQAVNAGYKVYTTIDGRLQTAANRAVRLGLIEYDRRHGYRGPLRQTAYDASASPARLDTLLADVPDAGGLHPAIVVSVAPMSARVYIRSLGFAQIDWDGLSWAARRLSDTRIGNAPKHAEDVVHRGDVVYAISNGHGAAQLAQLPEAQSALVALDPNDGALAALVGGFDFGSSKFNRATQARRQMGSGFKPFLYSAALEHGFTPATIIMDAPIVFDDPAAEKSWRPENNNGEFNGPTRLREALVHSLNRVSVRVARQMGVDVAIDYATQFGFNRSDMPHDLTIALGSLDETPLQVVSAYAGFANGGYRIAPYFIDRIENGAGQVVWSASPQIVCQSCDALATAAVASTAAVANATSIAPPVVPVAAVVGTAPATAAAPVDNSSPAAGADRLPPLRAATLQAPRIISPANAWLMDDMMADVIKHGTGRGALALQRSDISGKTGTTNDWKDAWFNGFNRNIVASVWMGYDDQQRSLGEREEGAHTALPIWIDFMREALRATPDRPRPLPAGLVSARISAKTGLLAGADDSDAIYETFMEDHLPAEGSLLTAPGASQNPTAGGEPLF